MATRGASVRPADRPLGGLARVVILAWVAFDMTTGPPTRAWYGWPLAAVTESAMVLSVFLPPLAPVLVLLLMASTHWFGELNAWQAAMFASAISVTYRVRPRLVGIVLASYAVGLWILWRPHHEGYVAWAAGFTVFAVAVGLVARLLTRRQRLAGERIRVLSDAVQRLHREERTALADELSTLLARSFADNHRLLSQLGPDVDRGTVQEALAAVDRDSRAVLGRLRRLVTVLHPGWPTQDAGAASPSLEAVEEELVGHAFRVEVEDELSPGTLDEDTCVMMDRALVFAADHVMTSGTPGGRCVISLRAHEGRARLVVRHESADGPVAHPPTDQALQEVVAACGGIVEVAQGPGEWVLCVIVPLLGPGEQQRPPTSARRLVRGGVMPNPWSSIVVLGALLAAALQASRLLGAHTAAAAVFSGLWLVTWLMAALAVFRPRAAAALLVLLITIGGAVGVGGRVPEPALGQMFILTTLLTTRRPRRMVALALGAAALLVPQGVQAGWSSAVACYMFGMLGFLLGTTVNHFLTQRDIQSAELERLELEREQARATERRLLASELHDIVAHQLSMVSLEISSHVGTGDRAELLETAARVDRVNTSAQADLDTLVALLREDVDPPAGAAQDGSTPTGLATPVATARAVVENLSRAGFPTDLVVDEDADECDPTTARTLSRVLRESSTNVLRYADPGTRCQVELLVDGPRVTARVASQLPRVGRANPASTGLGLEGLAERVRLTGGVFTAGPSLGQWRVACELERVPAEAGSVTPRAR